MRGSGVLSPKGWFGALGAGQGTLSPELCPLWLLVASALAALTPSPGSGADHGLLGSTRMPGRGQHRDKDPIPCKPPKSSKAAVGA